MLYDRCINALYDECGEYKSKILNNALKMQFCDFIEDFIGSNLAKLCEHYTLWQKEKMEEQNIGELIPLDGSEEFIRKYGR